MERKFYLINFLISTSVKIKYIHSCNFKLQGFYFLVKISENLFYQKLIKMWKPSINYIFSITTTALPYRAKPVEISGKTPKSITIKITPDFRESEWHPNIPITDAIIHQRAYIFNQPKETAFKTTRMKLSGPAPVSYTHLTLPTILLV